MRKKIATAITAVALATSLTACSGAGNDAPTRMITQVTDGVEANLASEGNLIYLRNIYIALNAAGEASLVGTIINQKETNDALIAVAVNRAEIKIEPQAALFHKPITFGGESATASLPIPAESLIAGKRVPVSFFFGIAGSVSVDALIVNA
jgi:hypothetical protein